MYKYKTRQLATPPTISSENISRYWYDDSAFKTGFLNSLSSLFEGGEKFFMKSLNYYTPQYPEYKKEVLDENNTEYGYKLSRHLILLRE